MTSTHRWRSAVLQRFAEREELDREELYRRYFSGSVPSLDSLTGLFDFIEDEFRVPVGVLQPEDDLALLFDPVPSRWPWGTLVNQVSASDKRLELADQLHKRLTTSKTRDLWTNVPPFGALVRAWSGAMPDV